MASKLQFILKFYCIDQFKQKHLMVINLQVKGES